MIWGLGHLARRDAIKEHDGPALISNWKVDMVSFHNHHHPKYFILGHRLIAGVSGWLPDRLRQDLIWNRTVNYRGGQSNNIEMGMMNEFLNREFKDMSPGLVNSRLVHRSGQKQTCPQVWSEADLSTGLVRSRPVHRSGQEQTCPQVWSGADLSSGLVKSRLVHRSGLEQTRR
ncbi:Hypothetical predicted protein [Mytilus galloprovincialis]|uniref:Uncharacterized protein n=1 Tax=Mytilus galloprovincialis TaxID=29158 RepID=A0A8B6F0Z0_MYTGA|nr:Hypothetical predicted protein [Mytilus galloprovincialis]